MKVTITTAGIRDVETDASTNPNIQTHIRRSNRHIGETLEGQGRILQGWDTEKLQLRLAKSTPYEDRKRLQLERIRILVDSAFSTTGFYQELYRGVGYEPGAIESWSDFHALPIVNKQMMVDAGFSQRVSEFNDGHVLHSARTSGSSGLNLTIFQDDASVDYRHLLYMRHCELMLKDELKSEDWRYGIYYVAERFTSLLGGYPFVTVSQDCPTEILVQHLKELRPRIIFSFPSYLQRLLQRGVSLAEFGVEVIVTNSERSSLEERLTYSAAFGVPVLDEYSSEEMSLIAYECHCRRYHLVEDSGYFEVTNADEEGFGRLIGTSFGNTCMPFIRYEQGDVLKMGDTTSQCECGSQFRTIEAFRGREDESLHDGLVGLIHADAVLGLCDRTLVEVESNVRQYQIVQTYEDRIVLRVSLIDPTRGTNNRLILEFIQSLQCMFKNVSMKVQIEKVAEFTTFASGKRRLIYVEGTGVSS